MRTWRTWFVVGAMWAFLLLVSDRPLVLNSWGWHMFASLMLGASLAKIINEWEKFHLDWLDRQEAEEDEPEE